MGRSLIKRIVALWVSKGEAKYASIRFTVLLLPNGKLRMKIAIVIAAVLVIAAVAVFFTTAQNAKTPQISQVDFQTLMASENKPLVLDVRTPKEFAEGHIPDALNISHDQLEHKLAFLEANKSKDIIVYCRSGRRATYAEGILRDAGFTKLKHLEGDMSGWKKAGLPIEHGYKLTTKS